MISNIKKADRGKCINNFIGHYLQYVVVCLTDVVVAEIVNVQIDNGNAIVIYLCTHRVTAPGRAATLALVYKILDVVGITIVYTAIDTKQRVN